MADRSKFEEMLELLVNENKEAAQELFHEIVVEKSRDIYESLLNEEADDDLDEADDEETTESDDEDVSEADDEDVSEDDEDLDEGFDLDEFEVEADPMDMMGGDATDDMMGDIEADDDEEGDMDMDDEEGDLDDRVDDLEDALEELKAEFEKMMGDEDGDGDVDGHDHDDEGDMDFGGDDEKEAFQFEDEEVDESDDEEVDEAADEEVDEADEDEVKESKPTKKSAAEQMREYVEKVGGDKYDTFGKMGDNGANTKSTVAGKNDMGGTTQNILRTDTEESGEVGAGSKVKGSALNDQSPKDMNTGNVNVPGGKAGGKHMKTQNGGGLDKNSILKKDHMDKGADSTLNKVSTRAK